jgi:hypothetical protein
METLVTSRLLLIRSIHFILSMMLLFQIEDKKKIKLCILILSMIRWSVTKFIGFNFELDFPVQILFVVFMSLVSKRMKYVNFIIIFHVPFCLLLYFICFKGLEITFLLRTCKTFLRPKLKLDEMWC